MTLGAEYINDRSRSFCHWAFSAKTHSSCEKTCSVCSCDLAGITPLPVQVLDNQLICSI